MSTAFLRDKRDLLLASTIGHQWLLVEAVSLLILDDRSEIRLAVLPSVVLLLFVWDEVVHVGDCWSSKKQGSACTLLLSLIHVLGRLVEGLSIC